MTTKKNDLIGQFEGLKDQKVPESSMGSVKATMVAVFEAYPDSVFTQRQFCERLNISNPFCNHMLHALMDAGIITRVGSARKYYYSLVKA